MASWTVGSARITRIEEQMGMALLPPEKYFVGFQREILQQHLDWLAPDHYSPQHDRVLTSVHSWLIRTSKHTILLDSCAGNHKERPWTPRFHMLDIPFLDRLANAGVAPYGRAAADGAAIAGWPLDTAHRAPDIRRRNRGSAH